MTTVSFPITLSGNYADGSVCSAADYRADFEKMRDAINHMHERFSTLIFTGHDITYQDAATAYEPAWGDHGGTGAFGIGDYGNDYKILNVMAVPSWMQGIRVRGLELCNFSRIPGEDGATWTTSTGHAFPHASKPLKYGIAYGSLASLDPDNWSATDIASIALDTEAKIRGPYQAYAGPLNTNSVFANGTGYHTATANIVVPPGNYIAIYGTGKVSFTANADGTGGSKAMHDLNWHFAVNALCDAMVPVL